MTAKGLTTLMKVVVLLALLAFLTSPAWAEQRCAAGTFCRGTPGKCKDWDCAKTCANGAPLGASKGCCDNDGICCCYE
ncbi:unnamed protein product [Spirodela intermedia]|uniref:Uncharacterized protein n=1 Tax=Spirodela intermedia TaxID=51605 RepID=A0A7I8KSQ6_SPIIN|nr:unnamed protein product [Spirodela intermedia]